jgi:hypothetical protein
MGTIYAVVVAIENYQQNGIRAVQFAAADASSFKNALIQHFKIAASNIELWIDHDATQNRLLNDLPYQIKQLGPDDKFMFFYAGHGFFSNGSNRLTAWDSHPANLGGTTVSLESVLLNPLKDSHCQRNLIFIDACASGLQEEAAFSRDILTDLSSTEFEVLLKSSSYSAAFFSCSPMQKSYSSERLHHGIWSYYLLKALAGKASEAIQKDRWITGDSLKNYLLIAVPKFIRDETNIVGQQKPYASLSSNGPVEILQVPEPEVVQSHLSKLTVRFTKTMFRGVESRPFKSLGGFDKKRGNTVPNSLSASASSWAKRLLKDELKSELEQTKATAKKVLDLGRQDITLKFDDEAGGSIDTDFFRLNVEADQDQDDPGSVAVSREVTLRVSYEELPKNFDSIFGGTLDEIIIPFKLSGADYDEVANALEKFAKNAGAEFEEQESDGLITISFPNRGPEVIFDHDLQQIRIGGPGVSGCIALIRLLTGSNAKYLIGSAPLLLGIPRTKALN